MTTSSRPQRAATNVTAAAVTAPLDTTVRAKHLRPNELDAMRMRRLDKEIACKARLSVDLEQKELAAAIGMGLQQQTCSDWENPTKPHLPRVDHLRRAPSAYRRYWVRELAALDGDNVQRGSDVVYGSHAARVAVVVRETTDVTVAFTSDVADGSIDDPERILREIDEAEAAFAELKAACRAAIASKRAAVRGGNGS